jgi:hypothetical protein
MKFHRIPSIARKRGSQHCTAARHHKPVWPTCVSIYDFVGACGGGWHRVVRSGKQGAGYKKTYLILGFCRLTYSMGAS